MLLNDDQVRLQHIIDSTREALAYVEDTDHSAFEKNRLLQHGLVPCIEVIGEASARLSKSLHDANPQIPWAAMIGMRNRIVHAYFDIDIDLVWKTATEDLPVLLAQVETIVQNLTRPE